MKDVHHIILGEIIQKYSIIHADRKQVYFKHPILKEVFQESIDRQQYIKEADIIGLKSQEELLQIAIDSGKWNKEKEDLLEDLTFAINSKKKFIAKVQDENTKKEILAQIDADSLDLEKLLQEKKKLSQCSKESFVESKMIQHSFSKRLFYDKEFKEPIDFEDLNKCYSLYIDKYLSLSDRNNLLWVVFCPDLIDLFAMYGDVSSIFDEKGINLTVFQKSLLGYGHTLITKLRNCYNMPNSIKNNPIKIYEWNENYSKSVDDEDFNIREKVNKAGGTEKMRPEDKIT